MDSLTTDNVEQLTLAELRELQTKRLKQTLTFVYENSPVYKKKFDDAGVHPDDFVTLDDLAKFPFTTKQDLRDNYPFGMFAVPQEQLCVYMRHQAQQVNRPWWVIPKKILILGRTLLRVAYAWQV